MKIGLAACPGYMASGVSALIEILMTANAMRARIDATIEPIEVSVHAATKRVKSASGSTIRASGSLASARACDLVIFPALGALGPERLVDDLASRRVRPLVRAASALVDLDVALAAVCSGTFVLAEAGALDHRSATTSWWLGPLFRERYPRVDLDEGAMVVSSQGTITAGAAFAHIDLALFVLGEISPSLASLVSRHLVIDRRPSQSAYLVMEHLSKSDPLIERFERRVRDGMQASLDIPSIARELGVTRRTLERRTQQTLGLSPLRLVRRLRAERALHLRRTTDLSMGEIAERVGYRNAETLRALLREARADLR